MPQYSVGIPFSEKKVLSWILDLERAVIYNCIQMNAVHVPGLYMLRLLEKPCLARGGG